MRERRRLAWGMAAMLLVLLACPHPTADLRLITHDSHDPAPHRITAAVDLGLVGVSVLYTWSQQLR